MASETLSSWSVKLSVNAGNMIAGFETAASKMKSFGATAVTAAKTTASGVGSALGTLSSLGSSLILGSAGGAIGGMLSSLARVSSALASGGPIAAVAAVATLTASLVTFAGMSMSAVDVQVRLGRQLGITAQAAAGLQILSDRQGIASDSATRGLDLWAQQLAKLRHELMSGASGPVTRGLREMGIDARGFVNLGLPEQFARMAEASQRIVDPIQRQGVLGLVLSEGARDMIPLFRLQGNELRQMEATAGRYGYALDQGQAEAISNAVKGWKEFTRYVGSVFSMIGHGAALAFSPIVSSATKLLETLFEKARPLITLGAHIVGAWAVGGLIVPVIYGIIVAVQSSMPVLSALSRGVVQVGEIASLTFSHLKPIVLEMANAISTAFGGSLMSFETWGDILNSLIPVATTFARVIGVTIVNSINTCAEAMRRLGQATMLTAAMVSTASFGMMGEDTLNRSAEFVANIERSQNTLADVMEIIAGASVPNATGDLSGKGADAILPRTAIEVIRRRADELNAMMTYRNPFRTWQDSLSASLDVMQMLNASGMGGGVVAVEHIGRGVESLLASSVPQLRSPAAAMQGSVEAQRAIAQAQMQERATNADPIQRLIDMQRLANEQRRRQMELGQLTLDAIREGRLNVVGR